MAVDAEGEITMPLADDPLYGAPAVNKFSDGVTARITVSFCMGRMIGEEPICRYGRLDGPR